MARPSRARSCSTRSGASTGSAIRGRSTCTSGGCERSWRTIRRHRATFRRSVAMGIVSWTPGRRLMLRSLRGQLVLTYLVLVLLGLGGLIAWTGQGLQAARVGEAERELELQAHILADALRDPLEQRAAPGGPRGT